MKKQRAKKGGKEPASAALTHNTDHADCAFGARAILKYLSALEQEAAGLRAGEEDIELIHRARVATRRLRAALPLFSRCFTPRELKKWRKEIRKITRALGAARDIDVQMERVEKSLEKSTDDRLRPGMERLLLRLKQQREQAQPVVTETAEAFFREDLTGDLRAALQPMADCAEEGVFSLALYRHSAHSIQARLDEFLAYRDILYEPQKVTDLHEMRIAAKRLRYTIEVFAPLYSGALKEPLQAVRKLQDLLGDIHDCDVWLAFLPEFEARERERTREYCGSEAAYDALAAGLEYFRSNRAEARHSLYNSLLERWEIWQNENIWPALVEEIQQPLLQPGQLFPPLRT